MAVKLWETIIMIFCKKCEKCWCQNGIIVLDTWIANLIKISKWRCRIWKDIYYEYQYHMDETRSFERNIHKKMYLLDIHTIPSSMNLMKDVLSISIWFPLRSNSWIMKWKKLDFLRLEGGCFVKSILARLHLEKKSNKDIHFWNYTHAAYFCANIFFENVK